MKQGFVRARIDGKVIELADAKKLEKSKVHDIDLFIDRLIIKDTLEFGSRMDYRPPFGWPKVWRKSKLWIRANLLI